VSGWRMLIARRGRYRFGEGGKPRVVFYGDSASRLLKSYLGRRPGMEPNDRLFVSSLDEPLCRFTMSKRMQSLWKSCRHSGETGDPAHAATHLCDWLVNGWGRRLVFTASSESFDAGNDHSTCALCHRGPCQTPPDPCDLAAIIVRECSWVKQLPPFPLHEVAALLRDYRSCRRMHGELEAPIIRVACRCNCCTNTDDRIALCGASYRLSFWRGVLGFRTLGSRNNYWRLYWSRVGLFC